MVGVRQKAPELLQNRRGGRGQGVMPRGARAAGWRPPALPREVTAPLTDAVQARLQADAVRHARAVWRDWWRSQPSHAVDLQSDMEALNWWIICVFRRALYVQIVIQQPMVKGSMGQPVPNPLESVVRSMTADINRAEARFGMTTLDRFRLHFEGGQQARPGRSPDEGGEALSDFAAERRRRLMDAD